LGGPKIRDGCVRVKRKIQIRYSKLQLSVNANKVFAEFD
jgi:hypothetical protein